MRQLGHLRRQLPGQWLDYDRAFPVWRVINSVYVRQKSSDLGEWYDIHAAK